MSSIPMECMNLYIMHMIFCWTFWVYFHFTDYLYWCLHLKHMNMVRKESKKNRHRQDRKKSEVVKCITKGAMNNTVYSIINSLDVTGRSSALHFKAVYGKRLSKHNRKRWFPLLYSIIIYIHNKVCTRRFISQHNSSHNQTIIIRLMWEDKCL